VPIAVSEEHAMDIDRDEVIMTLNQLLELELAGTVRYT
jgi:bacterioferritin (cytochrome b1)